MPECSPIDMLSEILEDVPDLVFAFSREGRYLYVNKSGAEFLGVDPLDVIGYHWTELGFPEQVMGPLTESIAKVADTCRPDYYRLTPSPERGKKRLDISLTPLKCGQGEVFAVLLIAHDISEFF